MAKTKRVDPIKQREKRAKIAAAIGGALFLVVAAIEIPPVLKSNSAPPARASTSATTTTSTTSTSSTAAAPAPAAGELADTDAPPPVEPGELVSFSMFQSKNPFAPQMTTPSTTTTTPAAAPPPTTAGQQGAGGSVTTTTATTTTPATSTLPTTTVPAAGTTGIVPSSSAPATGEPATSVAISVNGSVSHVETDATFPEASPVFRLVSFGKGTAEVGIVGGSYAAGGATLTLHLHTPVTLENQTDGKRYTLELDSTP